MSNISDLLTKNTMFPKYLEESMLRKGMSQDTKVFFMLPTFKCGDGLFHFFNRIGLHLLPFKMTAFSAVTPASLVILAVLLRVVH